MAECSGIYAEDIVKNSQGTFGLVLQDAEETSDDSDSEDEALKKGQIVICWYPSGKEETLSVSKVKLADRSLLPGDVVKFANPQKGRQKGFVSDVEVTGSIKILTANRILHDVDCKELGPLQELISGVHVTLGPWLGVIQDSHQRVVLRLKSGARCSLESEQCTMLYDLSDQRDEDSPFYSAAFYPGQMIAGPSRAFKEAKWLSGAKPIMPSNAQVKAIVEEADIVACEVNWQVCGTCQHDSHDGIEECIKPPESMVTKDELSRLLVVNHFQHASIQIGDKAFYTIKAQDISDSVEPRNSSGNTSTMFPKASATARQAVSSEGTENVETEKLMDDAETNLCNEAIAEHDSVGDLDAMKDVNLDNAAVSNQDERETLRCNSNRVSREIELTNIDRDEKGSRDPDESKSSTDSKPRCLETAHCEEQGRSAEGNCAMGKTREEGSVYSAVQCCEDIKGTRVGVANTGEAQQQGEHDHTGISDSGDADDDSDGGDTVVPKGKGAVAGAPKIDSLPTHLVRYPVKRRKKRSRRKRKAAPQMKVKVGDMVCVEVMSTYTTVNVTWQDSSKQKVLLSTDLLPVFHLDELEFFPGDYVTDKRDKTSSTSNPAAYGVVLKTDHDSRTCQVKWFTREGTEMSLECDVSVYDITEHADFVFNAGDVVVRVAVDDTVLTTETPLPCIGQVAIVDEQGSVRIKWVDRTISNVKPQELYKIDPEDDSLSSDSTLGSDDEWETASDVDSNESAGDTNDHMIVGYSSPEPENAGDARTRNVDEEIPGDVNNRVNELLSHKIPAFLMLESTPEQHACKGSPFQPDNVHKFMSCITREMTLLRTSLPPGILVRGYEDRMDLWSVQISGPAGTPYEHGLFIFDVRLPPDYPTSPPVFHYLSQCSGRLNPNLYDDGKVCVSLLGTWTGKGSERWTAKSNLLQVLLSIQGLILCREPYYNEAGYEKQRGSVEGHANSRLYNEMVLLKLLQSMQRLITKPPVSFKNEVMLHFAHNGIKVVEKFQSWIDHFHSCPLTAHDSQQNMVEEFGTNGAREKKANDVEESAKLLEKDSENLDQLDVVSLNQHQSDAANVDISECGKNTDVTKSEASTGAAASTICVPEYPLLPLSKGFCMSLKRYLDGFKTTLQKTQVTESAGYTAETASGHS